MCEQPFETVRGIEVSDLSGVRESFARVDRGGGLWGLDGNVTAGRIEEVFLALCREIPAPGFLVLEVPCSRQEEERLRATSESPLHKNVWYLDGLTLAGFLEAVGPYLPGWIEDGMVQFGFGSHGEEGAPADEVFVGGYKVVHVFTRRPEHFAGRLIALGYPEVDQLRSVWSTFTRDAPGSRKRLEDLVPTVEESLEALRSQGLYLAETRPG